MTFHGSGAFTLPPKETGKKQRQGVTVLVLEVTGPFLLCSTCLEFSLSKKSVAARVKFDFLNLTREPS